MDSLDERASVPLAPLPVQRKPRFGRTRRWLRSRSGRVVIPAGMFLLGIIIGVAVMLVYALSIAGSDTTLATSAPPAGGDIVVQVGPAYITHLVEKNIQSAGLPGTISAIRVTLKHGAQMTITGNDHYNIVLGFGVTRTFTILLQPFVRACQLQMHVVHIDMDGIPVTSFAQNFEGQLNRQLLVKPSGLPPDFVYCTVAVRTETTGMFVAYSATPIP
ncbi:MAG: hypothetical protein M3Y81_02095 [Chloroflexota bacterium]|nr:hypothetical protein [Chloroflexota bacterium]